MNSLIVFSVAAGFGVASCLGHDEKHIEQRQYQPEHALTTKVWVSTATFTQLPSLFYNQFE